MILTTDKLTITLTCKLTRDGFAWVAQGPNHVGRDSMAVTGHLDNLTRPENAKRCLELFRETHRKGHAAFTIAPCDSLRSVFVAVEVTP
ncbi:hypothetical protein JJD66_15295 [Pseudomonas sp. MF6751]|uniref:hypothetical protein n=1 Tax=Pseudomonas TaxID=286 RepID=UPI00147320FD|nr:MULTISPECIES: hypothetical protein [Pseudomonas]MBJ2270848.1 hypothetical protein [Pseudomonas sp. MF6772]MBK3477452.1 hypothetical protein [Pseudomonas sp. MF6751]MCU0209141.1 hypothetical protein [Pseudomonas shahriarae]NMY19002.1 hypothetical protein [Pseudomonas sp. WS 5410]